MKIEEIQSPCFNCKAHLLSFEYEYSVGENLVCGAIISWCGNKEGCRLTRSTIVLMEKDEFRSLCGVNRCVELDREHIPVSLKKIMEKIDFSKYILPADDKNCVYYVERSMEEWNKD